MANLAKLSSRLNWSRAVRSDTPQFFLFTDRDRLADPEKLLAHLPRGAAVIVRHPDPYILENLARRTIARAHRLGLKVLLAGDMRLVQKLKADGIHLSELRTRRGPLRIVCKRPGFLITAAAHGNVGIQRAARIGANAVFLSPVFATASHPGAPVLGPIRFARLARSSSIHVLALGGINIHNAKRLRMGSVHGIGAITGWGYPVPNRQKERATEVALSKVNKTNFN